MWILILLLFSAAINIFFLLTVSSFKNGTLHINIYMYINEIMAKVDYVYL